MIHPVPEKMEAEIAPLFASMGQKMEGLLSSYSEQELAVIVNLPLVFEFPTVLVNRLAFTL